MISIYVQLMFDGVIVCQKVVEVEQLVVDVVVFKKVGGKVQVLGNMFIDWIGISCWQVVEGGVDWCKVVKGGKV